MNSPFPVVGPRFGTVRRMLCAVGLGALIAILSAPPSPAADAMRLQLEPGVGGLALRMNEKFNEPTNGEISISRLDLLLSGLALQRTDGSWVEGRDWHAFLSTGKARLAVVADGVPAEKFRAIRFRVGVEKETNHSDPNLRSADDPLNPNLSGLHWSWQDGYIFLAIEGLWPDSPSGDGGFSLHLGNDEFATMIELPVQFTGGGPLTFQIALNVAKVLEGIDFKRDGNSTHSRPGDPIAARLKSNLTHAFSVRAVKTDIFQELTQTDAPAVSTARTTPYHLEISQRLPKVKLPSDNPLTREGVELGRRLFHDPRLSINNSQSCASCHDRTAAFSDVRRVSLGAEGQKGSRHAMPLFNLAWAKEFFWDGRASSLRAQALIPIEDPLEMNESLDRVVAKFEADADYPGLFIAAFGRAGDGRNVTAARIGLAIEQFVLTLVSQDSKFDRAARRVDQLTEQEKLGLQLFITEHDPRMGLRGADCFHCHGGNLFTNNQFANNGLSPSDDDPGRMKATGLQIDRNLFKVPSLRNVAVSGPYMHDGRFATLEEVIEHYDHGVQRSLTLDPNLAKHPESGLGLTAEEKAALVAFLKTLTDETFIGIHPEVSVAEKSSLTNQ